MKKSMLFAAAAVVAMVGCTNEDFTGFQQSQNGEAAINFGSGSKKITRAEKTGADAAALLDNNFVVYGAKTTGTTPALVEVFDHYNVNYFADTKNSTESNSANWEYVGQDVATGLTSVNVQTIKYWDYESTQYDFVAYSKGKNPNAINTYFTTIDLANLGKAETTGTPVFSTTELTAAELKELYVADLITSYKATPTSTSTSDYQKTVTPKFRRLGAKIRTGIYETVPGYSVANVKFYNAAGTGSTTPTLYSADAKIATGSGTMSVYYPTVGASKVSDKDYNQAHIVFAAATGASDYSKDLTFNALEYAGKEFEENTETKFLGRTSATATYAGVTGAADATADYQMILPTGAKDVVLNLKVDYDLYPIDGADEVIHVKGATAVVPAIYTEWQPNYAYTYLFKISDQTNGTTGTVGSDDPAGLYPITFDAVVMSDEDGIQETITEVGDPAITTYQKGKVVTENDEYVSGDEIYVVVDDCAAMQDDNFWKEGYVALYTGEIDDEALQTISEASSDNCFFYGGSASPFKVTDANGRTFTLTSATLNITGEIPAEDAPHGVKIEKTDAIAKFSPSAGTTYVFQYLDKVADYDAAVGSTVAKGATYYEVEMNDYTNPTSWKITTHTANAVGNEKIADDKVFKTAPTFTGDPATGTLAAGKHYYEKDAGGNFTYFTAGGTEDCGTDKYYTGTPVAYTAGTIIPVSTTYYKKVGNVYNKMVTSSTETYEVKTTDTNLYSFAPTAVTTADCETVKKGTTVYYFDGTNAKKIASAKGNEDTSTGKYFTTYTAGTKFEAADAKTLTAGETYYSFATDGDKTTEPTKIIEAEGDEDMTAKKYFTLKTPAKYAYKVIKVAE